MPEIVLMGLLLLIKADPSEMKVMREHYSDIPLTGRIYVRKPIRFYIDWSRREGDGTRRTMYRIHPEGEFLGLSYEQGLTILVTKEGIKIRYADFTRPDTGEIIPIRR